MVYLYIRRVLLLLSSSSSSSLLLLLVLLLLMLLLLLLLYVFSTLTHAFAYRDQSIGEPMLNVHYYGIFVH